MMKEERLSEYELDKLREVLKEHIKNPRRGIVNSEHAFVAQKLFDLKMFTAALAYWHWITMHRKEVDYFPADILDLIAKLDEIDLKTTIPQWGTYGT
jgi:hypothetical protein